MGIIDYIEAKNRERVNRARREDSKKVGLGLLIGAAIGAGIGILTAPQSGEETRQDIAKKAKEAGDVVRDKADEYVNLARDFGNDVGEKISQIRPAIREKLEDLGEQYEESVHGVKTEIAKAKEAQGFEVYTAAEAAKKADK